MSSANLSGANLSGANLELVNLSNADLVGACLVWANLSDTNLWCANIRYANLRYARGYLAVQHAHDWDHAFYDEKTLRVLNLPADHNEKLAEQQKKERGLQQNQIYRDACSLAQAKALPSLIYHEPVLEVRFMRGAAGTTRILTILGHTLVSRHWFRDNTST
jgi:Pentapeptide repeats (8 copies)